MPSIHVAAKAVIKKNKTILLVKQQLQNSVAWDLPGGKIKFEETPEDALIREVQEEVGLLVTPKKLIGTWQFIADKNKDMIICLTYRCVLRKSTVDLFHNPADEKIIETKWMSREEIQDTSNLIPSSLTNLLLKQLA